MLRTRAIVGGLLSALILAALFLDDFFAPSYPLLFAAVAVAGLAGCAELLAMIPPARCPSFWVSFGGVMLVLAANWSRLLGPIFPSLPPLGPWRLLLGCVAAVVIIAFLREMFVYGNIEPGEAAARVAYTAFLVVYLGVCASFLIQLRWLPAVEADPRRSTHALMLTIFVPKCCDIGAYTAGRLFGRWRMTPLLSPNKTWEGAAGGILLAVGVAILGSWFGTKPLGWVGRAATYGIVVGAAGMFGDLAESLMKRESMKKDASRAVPGFGGVLDVIDSLLFAAPVSYLWLTTEPLSPL